LLVKGQIVRSPEGDEIVLADIGITELLDNEYVRVWDVSLEPGETHPWHLHHNPYVVLSLHGSAGRMDWLDGSEPRFLNEYHGGAVYRPISPVHRLTNIGEHFYQNRLVELKELGELRSEPAEVGVGARSVAGERPGPQLADGRLPVIEHSHVRVWIVDSPGRLDLSDRPHVLADAAAHEVLFHPGGPLTVRPGEWFVVELTY
jgi:quercetin dioxygenase-like cupin family protein